MINYKTDNLGKPVICIAVDEAGNCTGTATTFDADVAHVTFVCQKRKPFLGKATITWFSDNDNDTPIKTQTVSANRFGYYVSTLSQSDGLSAGDYHAYIDISSILGRSKAVANFTIQ